MSIIKSFFLKHNQYCLYADMLIPYKTLIWSFGLYSVWGGIRHRYPSFTNHFKDPQFATNDLTPITSIAQKAVGCSTNIWLVEHQLVWLVDTPNQRYLTWLCRVAFMNIYHFFLLPEYSSFFVIASYGANTDHKSLLFGVE